MEEMEATEATTKYVPNLVNFRGLNSRDFEFGEFRG
jgi:hypothetical protein